MLSNLKTELKERVFDVRGGQDRDRKEKKKEEGHLCIYVGAREKTRQQGILIVSSTSHSFRSVIHRWTITGKFCLQPQWLSSCALCPRAAFGIKSPIDCLWANGLSSSSKDSVLLWFLCVCVCVLVCAHTCKKALLSYTVFEQPT